jgi:hypothetical protein
MRRDPLNNGELLVHLPQRTSDQDQVTQEGGILWSVLMLVLGGLLTTVWIAFLLWAASEAISWYFG